MLDEDPVKNLNTSNNGETRHSPVVVGEANKMGPDILIKLLALTRSMTSNRTSINTAAWWSFIFPVFLLMLPAFFPPYKYMLDGSLGKANMYQAKVTETGDGLYRMEIKNISIGMIPKVTIFMNEGIALSGDWVSDKETDSYAVVSVLNEKNKQYGRTLNIENISEDETLTAFIDAENKSLPKINFVRGDSASPLFSSQWQHWMKTINLLYILLVLAAIAKFAHIFHKYVRDFSAAKNISNFITFIAELDTSKNLKGLSDVDFWTQVNDLYKTKNNKSPYNSIYHDLITKFDLSRKTDFVPNQPMAVVGPINILGYPTMRNRFKNSRIMILKYDSNGKIIDFNFLPINKLD